MSYILVWYDLLKRQRLTSTWLFRWESNSWASLSWLLTWFTSDGCKNVTTRMKASKTYEKGKNCNLQCEGGQKVGQFAWIDSTHFVPLIVVFIICHLYHQQSPIVIDLLAPYVYIPHTAQRYPSIQSQSNHPNCCWFIGHLGYHDHQQDDIFPSTSKLFSLPS